MVIDNIKKWLKITDSSPPEIKDSETDTVSAEDTSISHRRALYNEKQGIGGGGDIIENTQLNANRGLTKRYLETVYANFWAAAKIVDLKPDDVFSPGIVWGGKEVKESKAMKDEMLRLEVMKKIPLAVKSGRLYGTAIAILAPSHGDFSQPIDIDNIKAGEVSHILVADRFSLDDNILYGDPAKPNFGKIYMYRWNYQQVNGRPIDSSSSVTGSFIDIHSSRCLRFDGIPPMNDDGWNSSGDERWGVSVLTRSLDDIIQDAVLSAALADVVKRAAIPVLKIRYFRDMLARGSSAFKDEATPEQYIKSVSENLSSSKIMVIDVNDHVSNLEVHAGGLQNIVSGQSHRLAMIEGVPVTRFTGESATGLGATGAGDGRDWRITVEAYRKQAIDDQWDILMRIIAGNIGLKEVPRWKWGKLGEVTLAEQVGVTGSLAQTVVTLTGSSVIDEQEGRKLLNESDLIDLDEDYIPQPPDPPPGYSQGVGSGVQPPVQNGGNKK